MSFAIIRNSKLKANNLYSADRHNERKNSNYSNKDIDVSKSDENYHLIKPQEHNYQAEFNRIREQENLKGNLRLSGEKQSNIACEFIITSDRDFFTKLDKIKTREFFEDCMEFVNQKCGKNNVISSVVHMDETTPHMHVVYIPVVEKANAKGEMTKRINCSEFWKGYNSYGQLQNEFYQHCINKGYNLERGEVGSDIEHLSVLKYKITTAKKELQKTTETRNNIALNAKYIAIEGQKIEDNIKVLKEQEEALKTNIDMLKKVALKSDEINAIRPQKTVTGAIKGVTVEDIENLKTLALNGLEAIYELEKAMKELKRMKDKIPSMKDTIQQNKEKARLVYLEKTIAKLPKQIHQEIFQENQNFTNDQEWER